MPIDRKKRKCFVINYNCSPFGDSAVGGVVALTVPLVFGVPCFSGVVSLAVPLGFLLALHWCCASGGLPASVYWCLKLL